MSFPIPDILIESIIRDGIENMKQRPEVLDDLFGDFTKAYANRKYGQTEIDKIKDLLTGVNNTEIAIVHSFHAAAAKDVSVSIQLGSDTEDKRIAVMEDLSEEILEDIVDAQKLADLIKVENVIPTSYAPTTGQVRVPDSVDLSDVYKRYIYVDGAGTEFELMGGISNTPGDKYFFIAPTQSPDIVNPGILKSFLTEIQTTIRASHQDVQILLGVHAKDALMAKYLYTLVKYFIKSRKKDLIRRGFIVATVAGSDFTRDLRYEGDMVYSRFLTVSGKVEESWRSDQVDLIDSAEIQVTAVECPED